MGLSGAVRRVIDLRLKPYVAMLVRVETDRLREELQIEAAERLRSTPMIWAKIIPTDEDNPDLAVPVRDAEPTSADDGLPLPPASLWEVDNYRDGAKHVQTMRETLARHGADISDLGPVLDFGCGSARMLRCLVDVAERNEVWGVDINTESISWCEANLSPPFNFLASTTMPSLPFEDRTFGLIYAGSVFTHISELAETWLAELRRITRPGGYLYLTIQDQSYIEFTRTEGANHWSADMVQSSADLLARLGEDYSMVALGRASKYAMVFHDRDSLATSWGRLLEVVEFVDRAYDNQTAVLLRRRPDA